MKTNSFIILLYLSVFLIINSCSPAYIPNVVNAPMLTNKGELQASVHLGASGFNPQLAYAVTNHIGIMANASFLDVTSDSTSTSSFYHKSSFVETGAGYYTSFGSRFKFGLYGGAGFGKINGDYENQLWTSRADVKNTRFFLQPTVGITSKVFDTGLSTRLVIVTFNQDSEKNTGVMIEPAFTVKLGWDHIKAVAQIGLSVPLNSESINFNYQIGLISLGIQANFGKIFQ